MFQPQAASIQSVQPSGQQVPPQQTQVTNAQVTSVANTVSQPNISVAALQTAGLSINPAIVGLEASSSAHLFSHYACLRLILNPLFLLLYILRSVLRLWVHSLSSSVLSHQRLSSTAPCPVWLVSPARS